MAYQAPTLILVGAAQNLVLGPCGPANSESINTCVSPDEVITTTSNDAELW